MKNSEHLIFYIIKILFNRKFAPIVVICTFIYFLFFSVSSSYLICSNNICRVENRAIFNNVLSTKAINLSEIKNFSYYNDFDYLRKINLSRLERNNRYYILAETETGEFRLFENSCRYKREAEEAVNELNSLLSTKNANVTIRY